MKGRVRHYALAALLWLVTPWAVADINLTRDGWYRWEVPVGAGGRHACCYSFHSGNVGRRGCRLGHGLNEFLLSDGPCRLDSHTMQVFVEVRDGRVREIRPLSSDCPVRSDAAVTTLEDVSSAESIAWLLSQARQSPAVMDEAVMTISFHPQTVALPTLFALVEDDSHSRDTREQALFWLVQTDSDDAYAYIDRLLN